MDVSVKYSPAGRDRFEVVVTVPGSSLTVSGSLADTTPATHGSLVLAGNPALVASAWAFAKHEAYRRRLRSPEKRKSHEKQAEEHHRAAATIAEMVVKATNEVREGWCSACFAQSRHRRVRGFGAPAEPYLCENCGAPTVRCLAAPRCTNMANRGAKKVTAPKYCAEHRHEIPSFSKLADTVGAVEDWAGWLRFEKRNLARSTKVVSAVVITAAAVTPAAWVAAPAIGGAVGSLTGLTGAAATSHGLALLGGGSLATGGFGMAGGTAVVTAVGGGVGGVLGGTATAAYVKADPSFGVKKLRDGEGTPVLLASGFLTEGDDGWGTWKRLIDERYRDRPVYRVTWGAKELKVLRALAASGIGDVVATQLATQTAAKAATATAAKAGWFGWLLVARGVAANPWSVAKVRAGMTGAALADLIARTQEPKFVLVGHSLGARVMVTAAQILGTKQSRPHIEEMHLLGAAVGRKGDWRTLSEAVEGNVWNYWSANDAVLKYLYAVASVEKAAGQAGFQTTYDRIANREVTSKVPNHSAYFDAIELARGRS